MTAEASSDVKFEIGHVLFIDIAGYSKFLINEQSELIRELKEIVRGTEQVRLAEAEDKLVLFPTGDGMALIFRNSPEAPVQCALEIAQAVKAHPQIQLRMGIHSGPVNEVADVDERMNVAGAGINIAQRVMDCGDSGTFCSQTRRRRSRRVRTLATAPARPWRLRGEAWDAGLHCEPLRGSSWESAVAKKIPSPEETQRANALGGDDGSVACARGNCRRCRNVFARSRQISADSA